MVFGKSNGQRGKDPRKRPAAEAIWSEAAEAAKAGSGEQTETLNREW